MKAYKILIVDDIPKNIMVLGNTLVEENYEVAYARSGKEAIAQSLKNDFDLILLDIMMPEMDGYETCERILSEPKTSHIPIIFLTAKTDYDSIVKGFDFGAKDYITKPFNSKELLARVRTHLELKRNCEELEGMNELLEKKVRKRTKELREANEKIKKLDAAKNGFLGIISHEIRTPLNGILGSIELLKPLCSKSDNVELFEMLQESAEALLRFSELSHLISQLKINQYEITQESFQLIELIEQLKDKVLSEEILERKIGFILNSNSGDTRVFADRKLISKVIFDVLHNALKFNHSDINVNVDIVKKPKSIEITIEDDGIGFSDDVLPTVFEIFSTSSEEYIEGKGLSLAAAKLILDAHNGTIDIKNTKSGGAEVKNLFTLPISLLLKI
jgi:two-component system sensor histidine kinase/response regulator